MTPEKPLPAWKAASRERLCEAVLDAARVTFGEKGYDGATVEDIAARAEVGKGTVYNYFEGGKQEILYAVVEDLFERLCEVVHRFFRAPEQQGRPLRGVMRDFVRTVLVFFIEKRDLFHILMKEAHRMAFTPEHVAHMAGLRQSVVDQIVPALEAAMANHTMRPLDPRAVAYSLIGHIHGHLAYVLTPCTCGPDGASEASNAPDVAADFISTMLFDGLVTRPEEPFTLSS
mgnify:CR=1 FL=1